MTDRPSKQVRARYVHASVCVRAPCNANSPREKNVSEGGHPTGSGRASLCTGGRSPPLSQPVLCTLKERMQCTANEKKAAELIEKNTRTAPVRDTMAHSPYQPLRKFANMSVTFDPQSIQATGKNSGVTIPVATYVTITYHHCSQEGRNSGASHAPHAQDVAPKRGQCRSRDQRVLSGDLNSCKKLSNGISS